MDGLPWTVHCGRAVVGWGEQESRKEVLGGIKLIKYFKDWFV